MLHNSGALAPSGNAIDVNTASHLPQISTPHKQDENAQNLDEINEERLRVLSGSYNLPIYRNFALESGNFSRNLSTVPPYNNPSLADLYSSHQSIGQDLNWQNGLLPPPEQTQGAPLPNMQQFMTNVSEQFSKNNEMDSRGESNNWRGGIDNFDLYNKNKDKFSHFSEGYNSVTESNSILDSNKRKSLENTVKIIESMISNSTFDKEPVQNTTSNNIQTDIHKIQSNMETDPLSTVNDIPNSVIIKQTKAKKNKKVKEKSSKKKEKTKVDKKQKEVIEEQLESNEVNNTGENENNENGFQNNTLPEGISLEIKVEPEDESSEEKEFIQVSVDVNLKHVIFTSDPNIVPKDEVEPENVINFEKSVDAAVEFMKNGAPLQSFFECPHCNNIFTHHKRFLIHVKWHTFGLVNENRTEMARQKELQKQQKREARLQEKEEKGEAPKCKDCDQTFLTKIALRDHRAQFHNNTERSCIVCNETFVGMNALTVHMQQHTGPLPCRVCQKVYSSRYTLAKHMETHKEKHISCTECGKLFGSTTQLRAHGKVHERAARGPTHHCHYCGKGFHEAYNLQVHERTHRNEKPFTCDRCNSSFATNSSLKRHLKVSHNTAKPFECIECSREFQTQRTLAGHIVRVHPDMVGVTKNMKKCKKKAKRVRKEKPTKGSTLEKNEEDAQNTSLE